MKRSLCILQNNIQKIRDYGDRKEDEKQEDQHMGHVFLVVL